LGEERANAPVRRALGDIYRRYGEEFRRAKNDKNLGNVMSSAFAMYAGGDALDYRLREQSHHAFDIDVTERPARHAEIPIWPRPLMLQELACRCGGEHVIR
jgi:hypothetical protein